MAIAAVAGPALSAAGGTDHRQVRVDAWKWDLPDGFPAPVVPPDNPLTPEKIELGRRLFADKRLSGNATQSCASCHKPELAFTDGLARAIGSTGEEHPRSSMSLANVAYNSTLTWQDPTLTRLEDQARVPMFNTHPVELGMSGNEDEILARLHDDAAYPAMFEASFPGDPEPVSVDNITRALASFQRTLISGNAPYLRWVYDDDRDALGPAARRGMTLFFSERTKCSTCHVGFTFSGPVRARGLEDIEPAFHNTGLYSEDDLGSYPADSPGAIEKTGLDEHRGAFRAPTLRNIELTAPYMHDGSIATLEEVIDFYAAGGRGA
nr:di-heme enzyme [Acidobacteriota bacterium]NIM62241.1 di-heme enzyme [Acidobacteriota bacterium]NIO58502.1 di-heme enzyme [Acidobacteriota bacterium]NIQ31734.1 di-heme enzyme [Acidobacteriota bacterium]NIQ87013.1 di-heme enzyme [Acidobacteriota bacterium]